MDIGLLKTFLELSRTRHFGRTAENLFLTQSAVSARIRLLEETLCVQLFARDRNNIHLTPAGSRFVKYAESIVNTWNRARQETALDQEHKTLLTIGGTYSLWDIVIQEWVHRIYKQQPQIALHAEENSVDSLGRKLGDGLIDIGFAFEMPDVAGFTPHKMGIVKLVMVASREGLQVKQAVSEKDYVMVDWGAMFAATHAKYFPEMAPSVIRFGLGRMALAFLLSCGGIAYLAEPMVQESTGSRRLFIVEDAPVIERAFYAYYSPFNERHGLIEEMLRNFPEC